MNKKLPDYLGRKRIYNPNFKNIDEKIIMWEVLNIKSCQKMIVRFISTNSINRQGIHIEIYAGEGEITINGIIAKAFDLWVDECPNEFEIECQSDEGYLSVYNIFEQLEGWGKGRYSQMDSCGMLLEQQGNIYRYYCNDSGFESNFNKLVFEIELL